MVGRKKDEQIPMESSEQKAKRSSSFHRIRGLLTGESRKERRARKQTEAIAKSSSVGTESTFNGINQSSHTPSDDGRHYEDDESTMIGVVVDESANRSAGVFQRQFSNDTMKKSPSHDSAQRNVEGRSNPGNLTDFEKGQQQNSFILKVVLLLMDPASRRFELLQLEFDSLKARVSDVLAQIPISVTEATLREQTYMAITGVNAQEMLANRLLSDCCEGNEVLVAVPVDSTPRECVKLARPILSDEQVVSMLQASGIDASPWKLAKKSKKKTDPSTTPSDFRSNRDINVRDPIESTNINQTPMQPMDGTTSVGGNVNSTKESKIRRLLMKSLWLLPIAILLQVFHLYISHPISPGNVLAPGVWLSKCGLFGLVTICDDAFFHVSKDGNAYCYDSHKKLAWQLEGTPCEDDDAACIPGLQFTKEHKIMLGGKHVRYVNKLSVDFTLSPWPFDVEPKLKSHVKK